MSDIALRAAGLGKRYPAEPYHTLRSVLFPTSRNDASRWSLKEVSFTVPRGEAVGIVGKNGAGKTTLLKILARITPPTEGYADVNGRVGSLLEVGTGFHWELTGRENVYFTGALLGMRRQEIRHRFDAIVDFADAAAFIDRPVKQYSRGMHLRLAFSVFMHVEPDVLLLDEVFTVGDAEFQAQSARKIGDLKKAGTTILFVSHDSHSVRGLCERSILLEKGRLAFAGPTSEVLDRYLGL